jgi:predicted dehydrogenase
MQKLKVAVIGIGKIAEDVHIPYFHQSAYSEVVALCGRNKEKTAAIANKWGIAGAFDSIAEMLAIAQPDIVSVCTPNAFHIQPVLQALDAGCHVFCEKPPGVSAAEAVAMENKAIEKKRLLAYNLTLRQKQETKLIKQKIAEGFFGKIYHVNAYFLRRRGIPGWGNFTNKEIQGGGALIDVGVHILDLALHLIGYSKPTALLANTYDHIGKAGGVGLRGKWDPAKFSVEDGCFAHIKLANNVSITLQVSFALNMKQKEKTNLEIFGSKAGANLIPLEFYTEADNQLVDTTFHFAEETNAQQASIEAFLQACLGKETNICTAREGTLLQEILDSIYENATQG